MKKKKAPKKTTKHKPEVTSAKPNYLAFPLEVLPKSFDKPTSKEISFIREIIKKMNLPTKEYFNKDITIELSCYLENTNVKPVLIADVYTKIFRGIIFQKEAQLKGMNVKVMDIKTDPFNKEGRPFVGVVVRKTKKYTKEELDEKGRRYKELLKEIKDLGA